MRTPTRLQGRAGVRKRKFFQKEGAASIMDGPSSSEAAAAHDQKQGSGRAQKGENERITSDKGN